MFTNNKTMKLLGILLISVPTLVRCEMQELATWRQQKTYAVNALYRHADAATGVELLQKAADTGNTDAHADLLLARLLGTGITQDLDTAVKDSAALVQEGAARAHTAHALLLAHNLTKDGQMTKEELANLALSHYTIAAVGGDPIAQTILAGHYAKKGDCDSAMYNYKKAANVAMKGMSEDILMSIEVTPYVYDEDYPKGAPKPPSPGEVEYLANLARYGDSQAAFQVGAVLASGVPGVAKDLKQAVVFLKQAANENNTQAMVALANLQLRNVIEPNYDEVLSLLNIASQYGEVGAMTGLSRMYMYGLGGLKKDLQRAISNIHTSITHGSLEALYLLGIIYDGPDGPGNTEDAMKLWELPASLGHVHSAFRLAEAYRKKMEKTPATTLKPDNSYAVSERLCQKALPLYRLVAMAGEWRNLMEAAYLDFTSGLHTPALLKYLLLSDMGYPDAHINAARLIDNHADKVYEDQNAVLTQSLLTWQRAADSGLPVGKLRLGDLYYYGQGVQQDFKKAMSYYKDADIEEKEGMQHWTPNNFVPLIPNVVEPPILVDLENEGKTAYSDILKKHNRKTSIATKITVEERRGVTAPARLQKNGADNMTVHVRSKGAAAQPPQAQNHGPHITIHSTLGNSGGHEEAPPALTNADIVIKRHRKPNQKYSEGFFYWQRYGYVFF